MRKETTTYFYNCKRFCLVYNKQYSTAFESIANTNTNTAILTALLASEKKFY